MRVGGRGVILGKLLDGLLELVASLKPLHTIGFSLRRLSLVKWEGEKGAGEEDSKR
jgi:hypothetical protein